MQTHYDATDLSRHEIYALVDCYLWTAENHTPYFICIGSMKKLMAKGLARKDRPKGNRFWLTPEGAAIARSVNNARYLDLMNMMDAQELK